MGFSVETKSDGGGLRRTGFDSVDEAKLASGVGAGDVYAAAIYESDSPEFGEGRLVALIGRDTGWLDVDPVPEQWWWNQIEPEIRRWLAEHAPASLPSQVWVPVVRAGGSVDTVQWDSNDPAGMTLTFTDAQWATLQEAFDGRA